VVRGVIDSVVFESQMHLVGLLLDSFIFATRNDALLLLILMLLTAVVVKGIGVEGGEVTPNTFHILLQMDSIYVVQKVGSGFVLVVTHGAVVLASLGYGVVSDFVIFGKVASGLSGVSYLVPIFPGPVVPFAGLILEVPFLASLGLGSREGQGLNFVALAMLVFHVSSHLPGYDPGKVTPLHRTRHTFQVMELESVM